MYIVRFAFRNFFRNTRRSIISGISVALAIAVIIFARSYIKGIIDNIAGNTIKLVSGHIFITTKEYRRRERMIPLDESIELSPQFYEALENDEIKVVSGRIKFGVLLGKEDVSVPALGYAIDPEKERQISQLNKRIQKGSYITAGEHAALFGSGLAQRLNVDVGDTITIITRTAYDSPTGINLVIKGIFSTGLGGVDRSLFYIPLDVGQQLLDLENEATEVVVLLHHQDRAIDVAREIQARTDLSVVPYQYNPLLRYINAFSIVYSLFYLIVLLVACSAIANTMLMVVYERTREIGMLKAMGLNTFSIVELLTIEAGIIGFIGSFIGAVLGAVLSYWLKYRGFDLSMVSTTASVDMPFGPIIYFSPTPLMVITGFIFGLLVTTAVALLPVSKVTRLEPAKALKSL
jgi:putative ABC transport system permease protein